MIVSNPVNCVINRKITKYDKLAIGVNFKWATPETDHAHVITVDGVKYSFVVKGWKQLFTRRDKVSFRWVQEGPYKKVLMDTLKVNDEVLV